MESLATGAHAAFCRGGPHLSRHLHHVGGVNPLWRITRVAVTSHEYLLRQADVS